MIKLEHVSTAGIWINVKREAMRATRFAASNVKWKNVESTKQQNWRSFRWNRAEKRTVERTWKVREPRHSFYVSYLVAKLEMSLKLNVITRTISIMEIIVGLGGSHFECDCLSQRSLLCLSIRIRRRERENVWLALLMWLTARAYLNEHVELTSFRRYALREKHRVS